jgi:uncharacterized membrane protein YhhN
MRKSFIIGFLVVLALDIAGGTFESMEAWHYFAKPCIIPFLIAGLRDATKGIQSSLKNTVLFALGLSWLGDVLLLFTEQDPLFFMLGLGAFLTAHIAYIIGFARTIPEITKFSTIPGKAIPVYLGILVFAVFYFRFLSSGLGTLYVPVLVYVSVITLMALVALRRFGSADTYSFTAVFAGALLFLTSDSLLAYNKFVEPLQASSLLIMTTYGMAQLLITLGVSAAVLKEASVAR